MMEVSLLLCMHMRIPLPYGQNSFKSTVTWHADGCTRTRRRVIPSPRGLSLLVPRFFFFRPSEIGHPPLETPITLVLYPALSRFPLRPATFTRRRVDIAIKIRLERDWRIRMPFRPTRWLVRDDGAGGGSGLPLKLFEFALLLWGEGMWGWARTERGWFGCHGTSKDDETRIEMEGEVAKEMDGWGRR